MQRSDFSKYYKQLDDILMNEYSLRNIDGNSLKDKILSLSEKDQILLLMDNNIRDFFLEEKNHYLFVWLIQELTDKVLSRFLDGDMINKILLSNRNKDKINAIMTCESKAKNIILANSETIAFILNARNGLLSYIRDMNYEFGDSIIDYSINNNHLDCLKYIGLLKEEDQSLLFTKPMITRIMELPVDKGFLLSLDVSIINKLISYEKFLNIFKTLDVKELVTLLNKGFIFPTFLLHDFNLNKSLATISNVKDYRLVINALILHNYYFAEQIEYYRLEWIRQQLHSYCINGLVKYYIDYGNKLLDEECNPFIDFPYEEATLIKNYIITNNKRELNSLFMKYSNTLVFEIIVDLYFKDFPSNVILNLKEMLNYLDTNNKFLIPNDRLLFYQKIYDFDKLSKNDIKSILDNYNIDIDYAKLFYEDYVACKNDSYKQINKKILKLDSSSQLYNSNLSKKLNIPVYELKGEPFFACVHTTSANRKSNKVTWKDKSDTISLSIIGDKNIAVYNEDCITFGFDVLDIDRIIHVSNSDSYTTKLYGTNKVNKIVNPDKLLNISVGYTELLYKEKNKILKPSYIVCFDYITPGEINIANELNLPIVLIHSARYNKKSDINSLDIDSYPNNKDVDYRILR